MTEDKEVMKRLYEAANEACKLAYAKRAEIGGAVNWARLRCDEVQYVSGLCTTPHFAVYLTNTGSSASLLLEFVNNYLKDKGFSNFHISAEW